MDDVLAQAILRRSRVDAPHQRLYCLGPNVGRINFASQQVKALNLVYALHHAGLVTNNSLVGAVGAGVSGITAAAALRAMKCSVRIYDAAASVMHRQGHTSHRHVHPTINWWPVEPNLDPTTSLPFFNWYLDQCNEVVRHLKEAWKFLQNGSGTALQFHEEVSVLEAVPVRSKGDRLTLKTTAGDHPNFDIVVVASGFQDEKPDLGLPVKSYWRPDNLEATYDQRKRLGVRRFLVSGFGDGGLIDALRVAYDFDYGRLSFRVAEALAHSAFADKIADIEKQRKDTHWPSKCLQYDEIAAELDRSLIGPDSLGKDVATILRSALAEDARLVVICDKFLISPYEGRAAPIHKLMIAFASYHGVVDQKHGELTQSNGTDSINLCGETFKKDDTWIVIRNGAKSTEGGLINDAQWAKLQEAQFEADEYSFRPAWGDAAFPVPDGWRCPSNDEKGFISAMTRTAQKAIASLGSDGHVTAREDRFLITGHNASFKPVRLFGKRVDYAEDAHHVANPI